ncbi:MAG: 50S ribosomal protein L25 [Parcubacteria group bacterium]|nr:50S ribosomal protein L25 [Parcubacteria group bacterium]
MELKVQKREKFGKQLTALKKDGFLPAELYGRGISNLHLSVSAKEFAKVFKEAGENSVIDLLIDGEKRPVMIYDVDVDPLKNEPRHVDFHQIRMDEKIETEVPLRFIGESPAVKEKGGVLIKALHEIKVEAFPSDIPHVVEIDIGGLGEIGAVIHVGDLRLSDKVRILDEADAVVATISAPVVEEEAPVAEAAPETIVTEGEEKRAQKEKEEKTSE